MNAAKNSLTRRANHGHSFIIPQSCKSRRPALAGASVRLRLKSSPTIGIAPDRRGERSPARGRTARLPRARSPGNRDMNTVPDLTMSTTTAATDPIKAAAAPRIKLLSHGFSIDHPDPEIGEQLMVNAMGVADREAMHGILRQLVKASVSGESPDEVNLSFMISMVKSIKPRDSIEAMLVAQMVSVHVMAMRCAHHLASADDIAQHDSAARALGRLARTFPAQRQGHCRQRHAACARDRFRQEPGVRGAEGAEGRALQAKARSR